MRLTRNFSRHEFTRSQTAIRKGIDNRIPFHYTRNLLLLATWLQCLRDRLCYHYEREVSISISSGYRSPKLNKAMRGAKRSAHREARAADIHAAGLSPAELASFIVNHMSDRPLDQMILEFDSWVHVAIVRENERPRLSFLRATKELTRFKRLKTVYTPLELDEVWL